VIVIDHGNHKIRLIDPYRNQVETISAQFDGPFALTLAREGKLIVGDFDVGEANLKSVSVSNLFCSTQDSRLNLLRSALRTCRMVSNSVKTSPKHFSIIRELTRVSLSSCGISIGGVNAFLEFGLDRKSLSSKSTDSLLNFYGQLFSQFSELAPPEFKVDQHSKQILLKSVSKQLEILPSKSHQQMMDYDFMPPTLPHTPNLTLRQ